MEKLKKMKGKGMREEKYLLVKNGEEQEGKGGDAGKCRNQKEQKREEGKK